MVLLGLAATSVRRTRGVGRVIYIISLKTIRCDLRQVIAFGSDAWIYRLREEEQTIAFRNEAVTIVDGDCGVPATVDEARLLGPSVIVALSLAGGEKIQANIPSKTLPRIGEKVHIKIDSERVFVFSA